MKEGELVLVSTVSALGGVGIQQLVKNVPVVGSGIGGAVLGYGLAVVSYFVDHDLGNIGEALGVGYGTSALIF